MCAGSTEKNKCSCSCLPFSVYSIRGQTPSIVLTVFTRTEWIECPDTNLSTTASKGGIVSCHGAFSENVITVIQNLSRARNCSAEGKFFCFCTQIFLRERKNHKETQMCLCLLRRFFKPPGGRTRLSLAHSLALSLSVSLFHSLSVTEIAPDFRSWWV